MNHKLQARLDRVEGLITDKPFLDRRGIGNEIACYVFDYPAAHELQVRDHLGTLQQRLDTQHKAINWLGLDLFDVMLEYLESRNLWQRTLDMQKRKGDSAVIHALQGPLGPEKLTRFISERYEPRPYDLILMRGVGSVWPVVRLRGLLNSLHKALDATPLVIFYPGRFAGTSLSLFDMPETREDTRPAALNREPYYRAFTLVPEDD